MKKILFLAAISISVNTFAQAVKIKDTTFNFTNAKFSSSVYQNDHSSDMYTMEVQDKYLVITSENDESSNSLQGYVFEVGSIDGKAINENAIVMRGVGCRIKGKARRFSKYSDASVTQEIDIVIPFSNDEEKKKFVSQLTDKIIEHIEL